MFKALSKFGKEASILFSEVDFGESRSFYVNRLLNEFSSSFDFHFINSTLVKTLYETQSDFQRREEEHKIENDKLNKRIELLENKNKNLEIEIQREKDDVRKIISDLREELMNEMQKNKNESVKDDKEKEMIYNQEKQKHESLHQQISSEINVMKENLTKMKVRIDESEKSNSLKIEELAEQNQLMKDKNQKLQEDLDKEKEKLPQSIPLLHKKNEDFNGIIKYLTDKTGGNIHDNGTVELTSNSYKSFSPPKNLLDFNCDTDYQADPNDDSWICFDFKKFKIKLTGYSIKSYKSGDNCHLKTWKLEKSDDGEKWKTIDEHKNCPTLKGAGVTGTFEVNSDEFSRYVRLHQTDTPWGSHNLWFHYIEFYGYLQE